MGNVNLFKTLGKIAGIGGLAIGLIIVIFSEFRRKSIFPSLDTDQAYNILKLLLLLTFAAGVIGVIVWAVKAGMKTPTVLLLAVFALAIVYMGNERLTIMASSVKPKPAPVLPGTDATIAGNPLRQFISLFPVVPLPSCLALIHTHSASHKTTSSKN